MDSVPVVLSVHVDIEVTRPQCLPHASSPSKLRKTRQSLHQVSYREITYFTSQTLKKVIGIVHQVLKTKNVIRMKQDAQQSLFVMRFSEEAALQAFLSDGKYIVHRGAVPQA